MRYETILFMIHPLFRPSGNALMSSGPASAANTWPTLTTASRLAGRLANGFPIILRLRLGIAHRNRVRGARFL